MRALRLFASVCAASGLVAPVASALPTMIRLGYPNCASCHISPQGGGLLNAYGRGIDQAQSLRGGGYQPWKSSFLSALNLGGRMTQDIRTVLQQQDTSTSGRPGSQLFRSRVFYRNVTELGKGFRFTGTVMGENISALRPSVSFEPPSGSGTIQISTALFSYRPKDTLEIAIGRDQLPVGINIADLSVYVRARNRQGYYDTPTQAKALIWGNHYLLSPYVYGPGGNEKAGFHEHGGGALAEVDLFGKRRTIAGVNLLLGKSAYESRSMVGPYVRLGFGQWGILAEHDVTQRASSLNGHSEFQQTASYGQLFWAAREWLVPSLIVERLRIGSPYAERLNAARFEISARLASQITVSAGPRLQRDLATGRLAKSLVFQVAMKTVH